MLSEQWRVHPTREQITAFQSKKADSGFQLPMPSQQVQPRRKKNKKIKKKTLKKIPKGTLPGLPPLVEISMWDLFESCSVIQRWGQQPWISELNGYSFSLLPAAAVSSRSFVCQDGFLKTLMASVINLLGSDGSQGVGIHALWKKDVWKSCLTGWRAWVEIFSWRPGPHCGF